MVFCPVYTPDSVYRQGIDFPVVIERGLMLEGRGGAVSLSLGVFCACVHTSSLRQGCGLSS